MPHTPFVLEAHQGLSGFKQLEEEWLTLACEHASNFLHFPAWSSSYLLSTPKTHDVYFIAVREPTHKRLLGVLPIERRFVQAKGLKAPILQLFYDNEMGVNDGFIVPDARLDLRELTAQLKRLLPFFVLIRWQSLYAQSPLLTTLGLEKTYRPTHPSKYLDISDGFDVFWSQYSRKFRNGIRKKHEKLNLEGEVRLVQYQNDDAINQAFDVFMDLENAGWKGDRGTSIKQQPDRLKLYQQLAQQYSRAGVFRINILYCGTTPIAGQLGIQVGTTLFLLKIGYDETFKQFSPGYLVFYCLAQDNDQAPTPLKKVSFVTGVNWMDRWHPKRDDVGLAYTGNNGLSGWLALQALNTYITLRDRKKRAPEHPSENEDPD